MAGQLEELPVNTANTGNLFEAESNTKPMNAGMPPGTVIQNNPLSPTLVTVIPSSIPSGAMNTMTGGGGGRRRKTRRIRLQKGGNPLAAALGPVTLLLGAYSATRFRSSGLGRPTRSRRS